MEKQTELPKPDKCRSCGEGGKSYGTRLNGHGKRYYRLTCTTCTGQQARLNWSDERRAEINRKKRVAMQTLKLENPVKHHRIKRDSWLKNIFGISLAEYEKRFKKQGSVCAICREDDRKDKRFFSMPVDHDHKTGEIRGILCSNCNKMLGHARDNKTTLAEAVKYLDGTILSI